MYSCSYSNHIACLHPTELQLIVQTRFFSTTVYMDGCHTIGASCMDHGGTPIMKLVTHSSGCQCKDYNDFCLAVWRLAVWRRGSLRVLQQILCANTMNN